MNEDVGETIGWPVVRPPGGGRRGARRRPERRSSPRNYGQAGAIDRYGPELGLPPAHSGHNGYSEWRIPPGADGPVVVIGTHGIGEFRDCSIVTRIEMDLDNEEDGTPVWRCSGPREPWPELWPRVTRYG